MPFALRDDQIDAQLNRILDSRCFGRSMRQRTSLRSRCCGLFLLTRAGRC